MVGHNHNSSSCLELLPQNRQCSNIIVLFAEVKPLHIRGVAFILAAIRAGIQQYPALCCGEPGSDTPLNTGRGGMENKKLVFKEASATK